MIPGLHGEWFIHYTTATPKFVVENIFYGNVSLCRSLVNEMCMVNR